MFISKFIILIFFLLFLISPSLPKDACSTFVNQLQHRKKNNILEKKEVRDYFQYSGVQGRDDLGSKSSCEANPISRYFVIAEIKPLPKEPQSKSFIEHETGICVPDYCDAKFLASNPTLISQFCKINQWKPKGTLILHDPNADPPRDKAFYILIAVFSILLILCIISTLIQNLDIINTVPSEEDNEASKAQFYSNWLFKSFDFIGNLKSLCATAKESGQSNDLAMFGFLRVISIIQIVGYHTYHFYWLIRKDSWPTSLPWIDTYFRVGYTALGHFFFIGGFLAAFTLANKASKEGVGVKNFILDIIHRLFKVYPGLWIATLLYWKVVPGLMNGTLWNKYQGAVQVCEERWIQKFFLIDNLIPQEGFTCARWTWYIEADFHAYVIIILLAYLFISPTYPSYYALSATIIMAFLSLYIGITMVQAPQVDTFSWRVFSPPIVFQIFIGAFFGFQYYEYSKLKLRSNFHALCEDNTIVRYSSMVIGVFLKYYGTFIEFDNSKFLTDNEWEYIRRFCVSIGTALFFVPLANNSSSIFKRAMNLRIFQILGKLCFGVYLFHPLFQVAWKYSRESILKEYNQHFILHEVFLSVIYAFIAALVFHLVLEKPLLNIEVYLTKRQRLHEVSEPNPPSKSIKIYAIMPEEHDQNHTEQINQDSLHQDIEAIIEESQEDDDE